LASKSKIPPKLADPLLQIGELVGDRVETFCFHGCVSLLGIPCRASRRTERLERRGKNA